MVIGLRLEGYSVIFLAIQTNLSCRLLLAVDSLCYAQIGGLAVATVVTLILVPVLYSIFVLDLKIIRWEAVEGTTEGAQEGAPA